MVNCHETWLLMVDNSCIMVVMMVDNSMVNHDYHDGGLLVDDG